MIFKTIDIVIFAVIAAIPFVVRIAFRIFQRNRDTLYAAQTLASDDYPGDTDISDASEPGMRMRRRGVSWGWIAVIIYELLLISAIALFYLNPDVKAWRIRRELIRSGIKQPIEITMSHGDAILTGNVATRRLSISISQRAAEIVGPANVTNRLRIETPDFPASDSEELGAGEVTIETAYDDSSQSLREIDAILNLPQFETLQATRGLTMQDLIARRYGIVRRNLPKSYEAISAAIKRLNGLNVSDNNVPRGSLKIPVLPARYKAPQTHRRHKARTPLPGFVDLVTSGLAGTLQRVGISMTFRPVGSERVVIEIPFTRGTAQQTERIREVLPFALLRSKMRIAFASGGINSGLHNALKDEDRNVILNALKQNKQRDATVFILDAGWPDEENYRSSLAELRRLVDRANEYYGLDAVKWDVPMTREEFYKVTPPQHSVEIQQALQEFIGLDHEHLVKVVYVPLSRRQNSDQILTEMLKLYRFRDMTGNLSNITSEDKQAFSKRAAEFSSLVLSQLNPTEPEIPDAPGWGESEFTYQQTWETDSSIVDAVWYLADLESYRTATDPVYFLNESWTVLKDKVHLAAPDKSFGIVVAAVGNQLGMEVNGKDGEIEFARLATPANNVLAALDASSDADEPNCKSAKLVEDDLDRTMAASFDGSVTDGDNGICGSSFSAPRIAWMLALAEAVRTDTPDVRHWAESVQQRLIAAREPGSWLQWKKLYLHPKRILP